jgi:peptidoglycan/LPS O-acetylase OafA/YrhL
MPSVRLDLGVAKPIGSLLAVSFFVSNVFFWRQSGYFAAVAEEKPLLHTWSLAVEEQFYLLFPLLFLLIWRLGRNRMFWILFALACLSFLISEWGWRNKATANFCLAPTRAWELLAGSIVAMFIRSRGVQRHNGFAMLGILAIGWSIFTYDETTPFPSFYALAPILGTSFVILYADKETLTGRVLGMRPLVGIGLVSYSTYLWHQPLFAFARIRMQDQPSIWIMLFLSVFSVVLSIPKDLLKPHLGSLKKFHTTASYLSCQLDLS